MDAIRRTREREVRVTDAAFATYAERLITILEEEDPVASDRDAARRAIAQIQRAIANDEVPFTHVDAVRRLARRLEIAADSLKR